MELNLNLLEKGDLYDLPLIPPFSRLFFFGDSMSLRDVRTFSILLNIPNSSIDSETISIGSPHRLMLNSLTVYSMEINQPLIDIQIYLHSDESSSMRYVCGGFVWSSTETLINAGNVVLETPMGLSKNSTNYLTIYHANRDSSSWKIKIEGVVAR